MVTKFALKWGVMQNEHFEALESFWKDTTEHRIDYGSVEGKAVLILPSNYGWGMRKPDDHIWGFWGADEKSPQIWMVSRELLTKYGATLDIIFDDPAFPV